MAVRFSVFSTQNRSYGLKNNNFKTFFASSTKYTIINEKNYKPVAVFY